MSDINIDLGPQKSLKHLKPVIESYSKKKLFSLFLPDGPFYIAFVFNIGIKHGFPGINICWASWEVLKLEPERRGFQHRPRDPADVNVSEKHV